MTTTLGLVADIEVGYPFKSSGFTQDPQGTPLLRGDNIGQGSCKWDRTERWPHNAEVDTRYNLEAGDVVLAMDRPWVEAGLKFATLRHEDTPALLVQRVARLRARPGNSQGYVSAIISDPRFTEYILSIQTGTSIPHISSRQIANYPVNVPNLGEQQAIAEVLGALDDKIAANTKLSATALGLAHTNFHQAVLSASFNGSTFAHLATVGGGGTPSTKVAEYWDGTIPWATPTDVTGLAGPYLESTSRTITAEGLSSCASSLYPSGTILMTSRATIGAFAIAQVDTAVNQGFITVQPFDPTLKYWLFHEMRDRVDEFISMANGATFLELSRGNFKKFEVRLATQQTMSEFARSAESLHAVAREALRQNQVLSSIRDALLPQLMSGKLRVKDAEALVATAV